MTNSLQKDIENYIGPLGYRVLIKALNKQNLDKNELPNYLNGMQIVPRALLSWAFNIAKNATETTKNFNVPNTDYTLTLKKTQNKLDFKIVQKTETILAQDSVELPSLITSLLDVTKNLDIVDKFFTNDDMSDLQKAINYLVEKFHFQNTKVVISKSDSFADCPDCNGQIDLNKSKLCICFSFLKKSLHVRKSENGALVVNFGGKWDKSNIYLLMKTLKAKSR